ncbi:hypothetical protein [Hamadaea tsunoensis]|uniref:hypothetical protein n=1 Tax=Hamadaea tsunoensis TaxID=53368 RepID=UPI0003F804DC|nr:hypothetical protein [Hamadaea tsunoensis]
MHTLQTFTDPVTEIACDESGWEGSNFAAANSDVIAYASVGLTAEAAEECVRTLRGSSSRPGDEFKAGHLMRLRDGSQLAAFLGPAGPVHGLAWVHLTHKSCFVLRRAFDIFLGDFADTRSLGLRPDERLSRQAAELCRTGPDAYGREPWQAFLLTANAVLRANRHPQVHAPVDAFFAALDVLRRSRGSDILDELHDARAGAYAARTRLLDGHVLHPVLEPLIPALVRTALHWSGGERPIAIVHDEQSALTERRMHLMEQVLAEPPIEAIRRPEHGRFLRLRQADSRTEPRVQVADLLAGVARKIASDSLRGAADPALTAALRPYLDPASCWCGRSPLAEEGSLFR